MFHHKLKSVYVNEISNAFDNLKALLREFSDLFTNKMGGNKRLKAKFHIEKRCYSHIL